MKKKVVIAAAIIGLSAATVFAHGGATGIVKERMDMMGDLKNAVKSLVPMMKGDIDADPQKIVMLSRIIQENSGKHMTEKFPEGSIHGPSEATPTIWSDWEGFQNLADDLGKLAKGLEAAAENPLHSPDMMGETMSSTNMMSQSMMSMGQGMMETSMNIDTMQFDKMPPNGVFNMLTQNCSACHTKYRIEN